MARRARRRPAAYPARWPLPLGIAPAVPQMPPGRPARSRVRFLGVAAPVRQAVPHFLRPQVHAAREVEQEPIEARPVPVGGVCLLEIEAARVVRVIDRGAVEVAWM